MLKRIVHIQSFIFTFRKPKASKVIPKRTKFKPPPRVAKVIMISCVFATQFHNHHIFVPRPYGYSLSHISVIKKIRLKNRLPLIIGE